MTWSEKNLLQTIQLKTLSFDTSEPQISAEWHSDSSVRWFNWSHQPLEQEIPFWKPIMASLVGGFNPSEKILVKMGIFPNFRGENKQYLSCHHLVQVSWNVKLWGCSKGLNPCIFGHGPWHHWGPRRSVLSLNRFNTALFRCLFLQGGVGWGGCTPQKMAGSLKWRFGRWFSFSKGWFSGSMFVFGWVYVSMTQNPIVWYYN